MAVEVEEVQEKEDVDEEGWGEGYGEFFFFFSTLKKRKKDENKTWEEMEVKKGENEEK